MGPGTQLGHNVVLYPSVRLGADCVVMDGAVLGRVPIGTRTTTRPIVSEYRDLVIGDRTIVGANSVLYTGSMIGADVLIGDLASIREGCHIDDGAVIGRGVMLLYDCRVGRSSRIQDQAHLVGNIIIEDHVFIGMGVVTTNDNAIYRSRFGLGDAPLLGPIIRRLAVVGAGSTILEGVEIGTGALVGAGSLVSRSVPPWTVAMGVPARFTKSVPEEWKRDVLAAVEDR